MLEGGEYDSSESLARAILTHAVDVLMERDWFLRVVDVDGTKIAYGIAPTAASVEHVELGGGFRTMTLAVRSGKGHMAHIASKGW